MKCEHVSNSTSEANGRRDAPARHATRLPKTSTRLPETRPHAQHGHNMGNMRNITTGCPHSFFLYFLKIMKKPDTECRENLFFYRPSAGLGKR